MAAYSPIQVVRALVLLFLWVASTSPLAAGQSDAPGGKEKTPASIPNEWIDPTTGHRVVLLSRLAGSSSKFYFHVNPFTQDGDEMVFANTPPHGPRRLQVINLQTLEVRQLTDRDSSHEVVARKRREVIFLDKGAVYATHLDTLKTREIAKIPPEWEGSKRGVSTLNSDETMFAGYYAEGMYALSKVIPSKEWVGKIYAAKLPNLIYTVNIETGKVNVIYRENEWLDHAQFSPTDPSLLTFCHNGPAEKVQRIWMIRADGSGLQPIHKRTVPNEAAVHEFWQPDGLRVWFDLQIPLWKDFYLAGADIRNGEEIRYHMERDQWSIHYNISPDGKLFAGDGNGPPVAMGKDGKWIWLFRPRDGKLEAERLCSLANHDYALEPNVQFTPDGKWVVFHSNMHGSSQVYAVEVTLRNSSK
jgi:oligogalacturonide lyase